MIAISHLTLSIVGLGLAWSSLVALILTIGYWGREPEPEVYVPDAWVTAGRPGALEDADS